MFNEWRILAWEVSWKQFGRLFKVLGGCWEAPGEFLGLLGEPLGASRSLLGLFLDLWDALGEIFW